ncbi:MAG: PAS domain S-box protein [Desulfobaccales bacterium]
MPTGSRTHRDEAVLLPGEACLSLRELEDFPDAVLITDGNKKVVFLNRAATELLGETFRVGDECPICSQLTGLLLSVDGKIRHGSCPQHGESLKDVPLLLKAGWSASRPLSVTASPRRDKGGKPEGCFVVLREMQQSLQAHPVVELQMATLSSILENFPTPFFMVDPELRVIHVNEAMEKLTGYSRSEVVGRMSCGAMLNTVQCDTCDCVLKQVMENKKPLSGLRRVVRDRQGKEIQVVVSASIITDPGGRVIGGFEAVRDITPLVEAEVKFDLMTELTREGIMLVDENQRILFVNNRMGQIVGRSKEEMLGKLVEEVLSGHHHRSAKQLAEMINQDQEWGLRFCSTLAPLPASPQSERRVFETCMGGQRFGENILVCIYLRDLSERIKIGRELHKTNSFLNEIIRCSVDGIVVVDTKGNPLIFNEGAERILGYKAKEVIGHPEVFAHFYPPALAHETMRRMRSNRYGPPDKLPATQVTFINKEGEGVPVRLSAALLREGVREVGSVGIFSDLREYQRMAKKLAESQAQLLQTEKIASLGRLAAGVAHEINNPLAGILIYAEILKRDLQDNATVQDNIEVIINQTVRCQQIVTRLLEFSRQSLGQKTLFDLNEIIDRCVDLLSNQSLFHNIEILRDLDPELPQIIGDPGQLQQVVANLLLNAADAMKGRGQVTITSRPAPEEDGVILTLADTGPGIPVDIRDKIFEPFFTTKPPGKGTGLGLSIVYGVLQRHGGTIEVNNGPAGGTIFTVELPLDSPEQPEMPFEIPKGH